MQHNWVYRIQRIDNSFINSVKCTWDIFSVTHRVSRSTVISDLTPAVSASLAVATCDRLTVVISISHVWNLLHTEVVHLHTPALRIGTHFLL